MNNLETIQKLFAAYHNGDYATLFSLMDDQITWTEPGYPDVPFGGVYHGKAGIQEMFGKEAKLLQVKQFNITGFAQNENQVLALGNDTTEVISTGKTYTTDFVMCFTLSNGLVTAVQVYMDTNEIAKDFRS